jgi:hypothetical protein
MLNFKLVCNQSLGVFEYFNFRHFIYELNVLLKTRFCSLDEI